MIIVRFVTNLRCAWRTLKSGREFFVSRCNNNYYYPAGLFFFDRRVVFFYIYFFFYKILLLFQTSPPPHIIVAIRIIHSLVSSLLFFYGLFISASGAGSTIFIANFLSRVARTNEFRGNPILPKIIYTAIIYIFFRCFRPRVKKKEWTTWMNYYYYC